MDILDFITFLIVFGGLIFAICYCYRYDAKCQKRFEERQERFVHAIEELRDYFYHWYNK